MFKRGGSAGQGITSGLDRPGYAEAGSVDIDEVIRLKEQMKPLYGEPPRGYNTNDFLIDWGLKMASATPQGNVISTGAAAAQEPFGKLTKGKADTEMAEYLSDVKATDQALGAVTDIAVAKAKAAEFNKDYKIGRRINDKAKDIAANAAKNPGSPGALYAGYNAFGLAEGEVFIEDLIQKTDGPVRASVIRNYEMDPKSKTWNFDPSKLSGDLVWFDPEEKQWATIENAGTAKAKAIYHGSYDIAVKNIGTGSSTGYDVSGMQLPIDLESQEKEGSLIELQEQIKEKENKNILEEEKELAKDLTWEGYFTKIKLENDAKLRKEKEREEYFANAKNALYEQ
tara:strand:- start:4060 stop:5079 length:1020 start_codon:yes stop_codon:yes gene_type:complete